MTKNSEELVEDEEEEKQEQLYQQLEKWKAALHMNNNLQSNYREEVNKHRSRRDELKEEINRIREAAFKEKDLRDNINAEVAKLKEDRTAASAQIAELKVKRNESWDQVKKIRDSLKAIIALQREKKQQLKSVYPKLKRLEELDWTVMTTTMSFEKEQELMDEIDKLIDEVAVYKPLLDLGAVNLNFEEAKAKIDEFKELAQQYHELMIQTVADGEKIHERIIELVKQSDKHHEAMQQIFAQIEDIQKEEEVAHQAMVENIKELELLEKGKQEIFKEIRAIEKQLSYFKMKEAQKKQVEQEEKLAKIRDKKTQEALAKYESGKKLTMDEFSLLLKQGLIKGKD